MMVNTDEPLNSLVANTLYSEGFTTHIARSGKEAMRLFHAHQPRLVILSETYPDTDGYELCRKIKATNTSSVLFLTSNLDEVDQLSGFAAGADEYMTLPFFPRVFVARIKALLRRELTELAPQTKLRVGEIELDLESRMATIGGKAIHLTRIEFDLLQVLMEKPRRVFSRDELIMRVWDDWHCDGHVLESHISRIRTKFRKHGLANLAPAVRGYGYRFSTDQQLVSLTDRTDHRGNQIRNIDRGDSRTGIAKSVG